MKLDGNYRMETWETEKDGQVLYSSFTVDDEQVTLTYELWVEILGQLGFKKVEK